MNKTDVIRHFGGVSRVAEALKISPGAVSQWPESIPSLRQLQIQAITDGKLSASDEAMQFIRPAA